MSADGTTSVMDRVMLDDYGNPVGQLVVNMGPKETALTVVDDSIERAQDDALTDAVAGLPGIEPKEIAEYYPGYDNDELKHRAKAMLISNGASVAQIASELAIPERTILMWVANGHWAEARRRELAAKDELSRLELAETRVNKRTIVFHRQLEQAEKIRDTAIHGLEDRQIPLKSATEAWAAAAKTEQTILGLSEAGKLASAAEAAEPNGAGGQPRLPVAQQSLVVVVPGGKLPEVRKAQSRHE